MGSFPNGFGTPVIVLSDPAPGHVFEASNVYSMNGTGKYLLLVEAFEFGLRWTAVFPLLDRVGARRRLDPLQAEHATPFASAKT